MPGCLESVSWCDDVHVFDSLSTDATVKIAEAFGAVVTSRPFDGYASQRNAALNNLPYKHTWLLILDADERVPASLVPELQQKVRSAGADTVAFRLRRRDYLGRRWLRFAQLSPYYIRLVRPGKVRYLREVNEVLQADGEVGEMNGHFLHYPFSKGYGHWLQKHNQYSTMEAKRWLEEQEGREAFSLRKALFCRDFNERRYHQKGWFYKLPARPLIKWLYMVFGRLCFLDGAAGLRYAALQAIYEYFIVLKAKELTSSKEKKPTAACNKPVPQTKAQLSEIL